MNPPVQLSATQRRRLQVRLLGWFDDHRRELPWRNDRDPYCIWVSEVMLQQTTVKAVLPLYLKFLECFPTVFILAKATEQDVLRAWQGLGYYRRARWLHTAAQKIVTQHSGTFPTTPDEWDTLPGVGRYTRNAILSQAFDQRLPIVEANSLRVLSRLCASWLDPKSGAGVDWLWQTAAELLPKSRCGDWNQALMELGALVCTVNAPKCEECPVRTDCQSRKLGVADELPVASKHVEKISESEIGLLIRSSSGVLLIQLPAKARRWGTMWTIPTHAVDDGKSELETAQSFAHKLGLKNDIVPYTTVSYIVTRHRITLTVFQVQDETATLNHDQWIDHDWVTASSASNYPMSTHQRRLLMKI